LDRERRKDLFELIGLATIVGSLIFLAMEIRQNTNAIKATAIQEYTSSARQHLALYVSDPEMAKIIAKAGANIEDLSQEEMQRYMGFLMSASLGSQGAFRQWQLGVLPDEEWSVELKILCADRELPNAKLIDDLLSPFLIPSYIETVESECGEYTQD
jgi:predicted amino acid-binding ACT domain protein